MERMKNETQTQQILYGEDEEQNTIWTKFLKMQFD